MSSFSSSSSSSSGSFAESVKDGLLILVKYKDEKKKQLCDGVDKDTLNIILGLFLDLHKDNPKIENAAVYKTGLKYALGPSEKIFYHGFVVLQLKDYYISLDKHDTGLTIQVSDERDYVLKNFREEPRDNVPELLVQDEANTNLKDFIDFYVEKDFVVEGYNGWTGEHCKKFAQDVFEKLALNGKYEWKRLEDTVKATGIVIFTAVTVKIIQLLPRLVPLAIAIAMA